MRLILLLALLLALPAHAQQRPPARPEPDASLLKRAPALKTDDAPKPLAAPLQIGGTGWGPFRRLCVSRMLIDNKGKEVPETEPSCFTVQTATDKAGTWELGILSDPIRGGPRIAFATSRNAQGEVGPVTITPPEGADAPSPARLAQIEKIFRIMIEANAIRPLTVQPNTPFTMKLQAAEADPDTTAENGGFTCKPLATATLRARPVLLAQCRTTARTDVGDGAIGRIDMAGTFAFDIPTGMVLQYGYASFLFMEKNPKKAMPDLRWKGVSRQSLE